MPDPSDHGLTFAKAGSFYQEHCTYLPAMAGWFLFSALLSSYNKYVFGDKNLNFPCPLLLTSMHFLSQWIFSYNACMMFPDAFGTKRVTDMSWEEFLRVSIPCGLVTSGDVGLSNLSMVTMSITFYTMVKASTPVFVLTWAYIFGIVRITWALVGVVLIIVIGEFLTVAGEVDFVFQGFILCFMASILSGARWTLVQLKIQKLEPPLKTTVATMRVLSPLMFASMLFVACLIEQPWISLRDVVDSRATGFYVLQLGLLGAVFAISMILCEFYLIMHSNAIVLMIGGVIKEILTIFIGVNLFGDNINLMNFIGCCVVFVGVILYKVTLLMENQEANHRNAGALQKNLSLKNSFSNHDEETSVFVFDHEGAEVWNDEGIEMKQNCPRRTCSSGSDGT